MKLESQVVSLELAKRLKELGVEQKSLFRWMEFPKGPPAVAPWSHHDVAVDNARFAAFTVAELGVMLPNHVNVVIEGTKERGWADFYQEKFHAGFPEDQSWTYRIGIKCITSFEDKNEADARAKMVQHLIENKIVLVEDINARL